MEAKFWLLLSEPHDEKNWFDFWGFPLVFTIHDGIETKLELFPGLKKKML